MALRAYWKGFVKISLVSFPVSLYAATSSSARVSFHQVHKDTKNRIKLVPHDPELGPVDRADLVKGYEFEKGNYVIVDPAELDEIKIETDKTVEILKFVPMDSVDDLYADSYYYMAPDGPAAEESFRVFRDAMESKDVTALARVVMSGRERIVTIAPRGAGMVLTTLRYGDEVRAEEAYFEDVKDEEPSDPMVTMAEQLIDQNMGEFDPDEFTDRYGEAVLELVKAKLEGGPADVVVQQEAAGNVVSLMEALRQSVEDDNAAAAAGTKGKSKAKAKPKAAAASAKPKRGTAKKKAG